MAKDECSAEEIKSCLRGSHNLFEISSTLSFNKKIVNGNEIWNRLRSVTLFSLSLKIFIILFGGPEGCYKYITAELKISAWITKLPSYSVNWIFGSNKTIYRILKHHYSETVPRKPVFCSILTRQQGRIWYILIWITHFLKVSQSPPREATTEDCYYFRFSFSLFLRQQTLFCIV